MVAVRRKGQSGGACVGKSAAVAVNGRLQICRRGDVEAVRVAVKGDVLVAADADCRAARRIHLDRRHRNARAEHGEGIRPSEPYTTARTPLMVGVRRKGHDDLFVGVGRRGFTVGVQESINAVCKIGLCRIGGAEAERGTGVGVVSGSAGTAGNGNAYVCVRVSRIHVHRRYGDIRAVDRKGLRCARSAHKSIVARLGAGKSACRSGVIAVAGVGLCARDGD